MECARGDYGEECAVFGTSSPMVYVVHLDEGKGHAFEVFYFILKGLRLCSGELYFLGSQSTWFDPSFSLSLCLYSFRFSSWFLIRCRLSLPPR